MLIHYILDEVGEIVPIQMMDEQGNLILENAIKMEECLKSPARQLADTSFLGEAIRVSTVFLCIASPFKDREGYALFETMVFAEEPILAKLLELSEHDDRSIISTALGGVDIQKRYATKEEALEGHKQMCNFIEVCITNGWLKVVGGERWGRSD